jgi:hypothetical protein
VGSHELKAGTSMNWHKLINAFVVISSENLVERSERLIVVTWKIELLLHEFLRNLLVQIGSQSVGK